MGRGCLSSSYEHRKKRTHTHLHLNFKPNIINFFLCLFFFFFSFLHTRYSFRSLLVSINVESSHFLIKLISMHSQPVVLLVWKFWRVFLSVDSARSLHFYWQWWLCFVLRHFGVFRITSLHRHCGENCMMVWYFMSYKGLRICWLRKHVDIWTTSPLFQTHMHIDMYVFPDTLKYIIH